MKFKARSGNIIKARIENFSSIITTVCKPKFRWCHLISLLCCQLNNSSEVLTTAQRLMDY